MEEQCESSHRDGKCAPSFHGAGALHLVCCGYCGSERHEQNMGWSELETEFPPFQRKIIVFFYILVFLGLYDKSSQTG